MPLTIQDVIDLIIRQVPGAPKAGSADTVKFGDSSRQVTGIATVFTGEKQLDFLRREDVDTVLCGETVEWSY